MNKNHFFTCSKLGMLAMAGAATLMLASCAKDGYDDETFDSGVSNTQVSSVSADNITVTPSADGKSQTITWPVVMGAGGYKVKLIDAGNPDEPLLNDSIVEGCTVTASREEDVNYEVTIQALGNKKRGNSDAAEAATKTFSTFTPTYKTIPAGSDLKEWFEANPVPTDTTGNLNFDLEGGATYTLNGTLDLNTTAVTLRTNDKANHATIHFTGEAGIQFCAAFNMKYVDVDCSAQEISSTNHGIFAFSKDPSAAPLGTDIDATLYKWDKPMIIDPVTFVNCNFKSVKSYFFWDNQQAVCAMTMLIDNCVVQLVPEKAFSGGVFWTNKGGQINELYINNSTFYEPDGTVGDYKY